MKTICELLIKRKGIWAVEDNLLNMVQDRLLAVRSELSNYKQTVFNLNITAGSLSKV